MLTPTIFYAAFCIFFAYLNAHLIEVLNERIRHGFNGIFHATACVYFGLEVHWTVGLQMLLIGRLFFDTPLNLFRGLPVFYVPEKPRSLVDQVEKALFGNNGWLPKSLYAAVLIGLIVRPFLIRNV